MIFEIQNYFKNGRTSFYEKIVFTLSPRKWKSFGPSISHKITSTKQTFSALSCTQKVIRRTMDPEESLITRPWARTDRTPKANSTERSRRPNTENVVKYDNQLRGHCKIRGTYHGGEQGQAQEPKSKMGDLEDTPSGTNTNTQNENSTATNNNQYKTLSGRGSLGKRRTTSNNSMSNSTNTKKN